MRLAAGAWLVARYDLQIADFVNAGRCRSAARRTLGYFEATIVVSSHGTLEVLWTRMTGGSTPPQFAVGRAWLNLNDWVRPLTADARTCIWSRDCTFDDAPWSTLTGPGIFRRWRISRCR